MKDRNHFGPTPDQLMPDSENMRTSIRHTNGILDTTSGTATLFHKLSQAGAEVEMNLRFVCCVCGCME